MVLSPLSFSPFSVTWNVTDSDHVFPPETMWFPWNRVPTQQRIDRGTVVDKALSMLTNGGENAMGFMSVTASSSWIGLLQQFARTLASLDLTLD